jgi:DNA repair photolyase
MDGMRWQDQTLGATDGTALPGLQRIAGLVRSVTTPDFAGVTFHEVAAKSALNRVPEVSGMPFRWTINPTRGCLHRCTYCFARNTHTYLDLDAGEDFDTQIVVKTNIVDVLRRELARPSWRGEPVAMGTNTDPYHRAEGRYRLMPGIIEALTEARTPFSILTKGVLLRRDLPLLAGAATSVTVGIGVSLAFTDLALQQAVEPGAPPPRARLDLIRAVRDAGLACGVMAMPILPYLTDGDDALDELYATLATAGATGVSAGALHLRPGAREWFLRWLAEHHPRLVGRYQRLYARSAYVPGEYRTWLAERTTAAARRHGVHPQARFIRPGASMEATTPEERPAPAQQLPVLF